MSFFEIGPIEAFRTGIPACFRRTIRAWREPRESAFAIIPELDVCISSEISDSNSSVIFSIVFSFVITWIGIPGRISSLVLIWSFRPVAAVTESLVW